ncbi:MAG: hypothetical protein K6A76_00950 [Oribacterium sp.]|nr:hypothetical protein [Oribacterium sp.]
MQKSVEVIVGIWTWKHGHANRRAESIGVLSMTDKGGMTLNGRKHGELLISVMDMLYLKELAFA